MRRPARSRRSPTSASRGATRRKNGQVCGYGSCGTSTKCTCNNGRFNCTVEHWAPPLDARVQREARARATLPIVRRRWWALAICMVLAGLIARPAARLWKAERILEHVSQFGTGAPPSAAIDTEEETVAGHLGMFRARLYRSGPAGPRPGVVVVHGVTFRGIDEPPRGVTERKAHEYGLAVLTYRYLDRLVLEADREIMRHALRAWLHEDREVARVWAKSLTSPEAEQLFARFESHRLGELGRDLEALVREDARDLERLSPHGKLHRILCPVYLLHGADDSVIP